MDCDIEKHIETQQTVFRIAPLVSSALVFPQTQIYNTHTHIVTWPP